MSNPTTGIGFSPTIPAAPTGDQNVIPQGDNGAPLEKFSYYPQRATGALFGTVKPDGTSVVIAGGVISAVLVSPLTTKGDLFGHSTVDARVPVGADGQSLVADSTQTLGLRWSDRISTVGITIDGGGSTPATGLKGTIQVPFAGTLIGWSALADVSGSASLDIWKVASSAPPSAPVIPTSGSKISASAPVSLSSAQSASAGSSGVSTWTTAVAAWDVLGFNLTSVSTLTRLTIVLQIKRS